MSLRINASAKPTLLKLRLPSGWCFLADGAAAPNPDDASASSHAIFARLLDATGVGLSDAGAQAKGRELGQGLCLRAVLAAVSPLLPPSPTGGEPGNQGDSELIAGTALTALVEYPASAQGEGRDVVHQSGVWRMQQQAESNGTSMVQLGLASPLEVSAEWSRMGHVEPALRLLHAVHRIDTAAARSMLDSHLPKGKEGFSRTRAALGDGLRRSIAAVGVATAALLPSQPLSVPIQSCHAVSGAAQRARLLAKRLEGLPLAVRSDKCLDSRGGALSVSLQQALELDGDDGSSAAGSGSTSRNSLLSRHASLRCSTLAGVRPLDPHLSSVPGFSAPHMGCACAEALQAAGAGHSVAGSGLPFYYRQVSRLLRAAKPSLSHHGWHLQAEEDAAGWMLPLTAGHRDGIAGSPLKAGAAGLRVKALGLDRALAPRSKRASWKPRRRDGDGKQARVRVGVVSSTMRLHSSGRALAGLVAALARRPDELDVTVFTIPE